jgi:serine/threonine protein kinase/tetratricopeptide (TPR) repeat protein
MSAPDPGRPEPGLDEVIEAFEEEQARGGDPDLAAFLPSCGHPDYLTILCELVRVDMEYCWRRNRPREVAAYQARFPELFADPERARAVAFEAYRLRRAAEEPPSTEHHERFDDEDHAGPLASGSRRPARPSGEGARPRSSRPPREAQNIEPCDSIADGRPSWRRDSLPEAGDRFLDFRLRQELGRGAFGRVFLAEQEPMAGRPVALKVTADALGETNALAQLQHTNIVPIYSVHRRGPLHAVCMPYLGSTTLADVIAGLNGGRTLPDSGQWLLSTLTERKSAEQPSAISHDLPTAEPAAAPPAAIDGATRPTAQIEHLRRSSYVDAVLWLGARLADGLAHAHERGILHRDLKPANVLFTDGGEPMLLDFNLATDLKLSIQASRAMVGGTLPYMAPEALEAFDGLHREVDGRGDIFSLGVILFELLTGQHPYEPRRGPVQEVVPRVIQDRNGPIPSLRTRNRAVSPAMEAIVRRCLEPDPARRYQSARQLAEDLQRQLEHRPLKHTREPSHRERLAKWARRHPRLTSTTSVGIGSVFLIAGLSGVLVARQGRLDRLEARESLARLVNQVKQAELLLASPDAPPSRIEQGTALCAAAVSSYSVLSDRHWSARRRVAALPAEDQARLTRAIGELLGLWAQGETWLAEAEGGRRVRIEWAGQVLDRAEAVYGPGSVPAALTLIRADLARIDGRPDDAARLREVAGGIPLRTARERLLLVPDRLQRGQIREALALAEEASRIDPLDASAWLLRGHCLAKLSRPADAADCYSIGIGLQPGFDWAYFDRGTLALEAKDYARAIEDLDRVLAKRPDHLEARLNRALARLGQGNAAGAVADLDRILSRPEAPTRAWFIRARCHDALGQTERAARDRREGLGRVPQDELSWVTRGLNRLPDDPTGAIADFDEALKLNPRSWWALQNKANVLSESLGRTEEAVAALDQAIVDHPKSVPARAGRGVLLGRLGRRVEALDDAKACLALDRSADTLYRVACVYALTSKAQPEDRSEALRLLALAVREDAAWLRVIPTDSDLDPLRRLPEFRRLVEALAIVCE